MPPGDPFNSNSVPKKSNPSSGQPLGGRGLEVANSNLRKSHITLGQEPSSTSKPTNSTSNSVKPNLLGGPQSGLGVKNADGGFKKSSVALAAPGHGSGLGGGHLDPMGTLKKSSMALAALSPGGGGSLLDPSGTLKKSSMALAALSPGGGLGASILDPSGTLKKSSMALAALGMTGGPSPGSPLNVGAAAAKANSVLVPAGNSAPTAFKPPVDHENRPSVWTKSTTRAVNPEERRASAPLVSRADPKEETPKPKASARSTLAGSDLKEIISKTQPTKIVTIQESDSESSPLNQSLDTKGNVLKKEASVISRANSALPTPKGSLFSMNSRTSILVENLMKNIDNLGKPLRGPILLQFGLLYIVFLLILFVSWRTNWAPLVRFYAAFIYFGIAFIVIQLGRIAYARDVNSVVPIYFSLLPFVAVVFISREAHTTVFVLWFVSTGLIFLQSGHPFLRLHLVIYYSLLVVSYILVIITMSFFYRPDCDSITCGNALQPPISPAFEAIILLDCILVMLGNLVLEFFIKLNALALLERDNFMNQLYEANTALKKQLNGDEQNDEAIDLEAPLTRATQILVQVKESQQIDRMVKDEIDFIIGILSEDTDKLFKPDIYQKPADSDVHDWLNDLMLADKTPQHGSSMVLPAAPEITPMVDRALLPEDSTTFAFLTARLDDPEFDIFELSEQAGGRVLYYIGWHIFRKFKFAELYGMNESKFRRWLTVIESGYHANNPYHNALHAADVTHSMHYHVSRPRIWNMLKPEEKVAVLIAPIIHDYNHPGFNNSFMISTHAPLAVRYNDQCVLEHFHVASVYELMLQEEFDIVSEFPADARKLIREMTISMVLATDMAVHFDWIGKFKNKIAGAGFNFENKQDRKLLLNMAMKCSDINNPSKKLEYCRKWTDMIMKEFFQQGDEEKRRGLKVSMFMDRDTTDIPKCQVVSFF